MKRILGFLSIWLLLSCSEKETHTPAQKDASLTAYVNPFIGTGGHGHTYPGATLPFGMMQLSPDTRLDGWDGCSGYHYSDSYIYGFSHTHLSGTGVSDYGDVLLMPTDTLIFHNGADGAPGYRAYFQHKNEKASPGYYEVVLDSTQIEVALTVTQRAGMHRYRYPSSEAQFLLLDLEHRDKLLDYDIEKLSNYEFQGYRHSEAWATDQRLYFYLKFSHPTKQPTYFHRGTDRRNRMLGVAFDNPNNDPVYVTVGISAVDAAGAKRNAETEIGNKSFETIQKEADSIWERQLEKIIVESPSEAYKTNFYSALYHTMLAPNLYQDVDGRYRGMDLEIHESTDFNYYTVFSLWDTYRATHPLYTLIEQKRTTDFINTMLAKYDEGGILPIWDLAGNYTGCMIGYHGVSVIADAYRKGIDGFDAEKAFAAMKHSAMQDHLGLASYKAKGFIPVEEESESVSKTLEYAYDDWTIAQMAKELGKEEERALFLKRAQVYKNVFNPETGFMQGRFRNQWFGPFDPYEVNFNYTEANAWQYSVYVPQDISGLIAMMGGKQAFRKHLDQLFTAKQETSGRDQADITGLIGQYAHGNEPSHHMAYLYNFVNAPEETQRLTREILTTLYQNQPDGISGNEDCGQMSAWYIFSSLGFYPVTPGNNQYIIGSPLFPKASLQLENGKTFTIISENNSEENPYIQKATLNGKPLDRSYLYHHEIMEGGTLVFTTGPTPSAWGTTDAEIPTTAITESLIVPTPFIASGEAVFKEQTKVSLGSVTSESSIYYRIDEGPFTEFKEPIVLSESAQLQTYAVQKNGQMSDTITTEFFKLDPNRSITLETEYANQYSAGGNDALIDGLKGARDFRTGAWQGYQDTDVIAVVDLGSIQPIDSIKVGFLQDQRSWIFLPTEVECFVATQPDRYYKNLPTHYFKAEKPSEVIDMKTAGFDMRGYSARYIKIIAKNVGPVPDWHLGAPYDGKAWIFIDEIEIETP
ncbi:MAG: glycosyl hydrolase family 92 [Flavobacteriaceae bacterium]|uniref:GH92 family glycosyl hydrolase n=1 Tax=Leeuwenhoekiella sp. UBA1003 TaxID=1946744 RepID=UPI000C98A425|nr:GH92 family glycosyl hydrolase [Leeuwenhoekiella sp. UBA1003]MAT90074.1 glycosyl hydrolase family 92 [Flavobacteriaceae bacterium]|tara:strand:+ start:4324 stop:7260 length:2937 start_codon:yes stop_codon:yes gene_type:complete